MAESKLRKLAAELRDADDEITENHIHFDLPPGAKVEADATGRLRAISVPDDERVTPTDPPRAKPDSTPPKAKFALAVLDRLPPHWRGPVVLFALGIVAVLAWRGGALAGLWR